MAISTETSTGTEPCSKAEMGYVQWISLSLQNPPVSGAVKVYLTKAQVDGLDPRRIYDTAVRMRPAHWMPVPDYGDVAP